jgi:hypothetical protein
MAKLTEALVQKLKVPEGEKNIQIFDDKLPGFGVRKFAEGHASYICKFRVGKQQRKLTLGRVVRGNLHDMRLAASKILVRAHSGVDVVAERKKAAEEAKAAAQVRTLGDLVPIYHEVREKGDEYWSKLRPKSLEEVTRYLRKSWQPLHGVAVDHITRKMVKDRRDELVRLNGAMAAQRAHAALATFYSWAIDRDYVTGANPTADIKQLKANKRTRVLSEPEQADIWQSASDDDFGRIVKLLMLTGQLRQEIGALEWSEYHPEKRQIELPERRTKNKQPHIVPLNEPAFVSCRLACSRWGDGMCSASRAAGSRTGRVPSSCWTSALPSAAPSAARGRCRIGRCTTWAEPLPQRWSGPERALKRWGTSRRSKRCQRSPCRISLRRSSTSAATRPQSLASTITINTSWRRAKRSRS